MHNKAAVVGALGVIGLDIVERLRLLTLRTAAYLITAAI
jgi:hypothetical protein